MSEQDKKTIVFFIIWILILVCFGLMLKNNNSIPRDYALDYEYDPSRGGGYTYDS